MLRLNSKSRTLVFPPQLCGAHCWYFITVSLTYSVVFVYGIFVYLPVDVQFIQHPFLIKVLLIGPKKKTRNGHALQVFLAILKSRHLKIFVLYA